MLTLTEKLHEINELRKKALADPEFIRSAKAHESAIKEQSRSHTPQKVKKREKAKQKSFADVYHETNFSVSPVGMQH
ncbi:hypothetical protein L3Q72_09345 [Vibrio sp. JC009]|uniref:hypothetical protein n=1 Tax=Vibrio sp. JC009 TaxID=2912314 RepID=UPI0023B00006|nr:hypothetical protein [Vibrio sp. JC009]WED20848.1 hypothetical protein L3Q72_09345 [Vibrio sp. JC009]